MNVSSDDQYISRRVYVTGAYEGPELLWITKHTHPGWVVADIGANIGVHSLVLANSVGVDGKVHTFEPTRAFDLLKNNIELNSFSSRCQLNHCAVGHEDGTMLLHECQPGSEAFTSAGQPQTAGNPTGRTLSVPMVSLDTYASANSIGQLDFVKLDVEGAEVKVLDGARNLLAQRRIKVIMLEFNHTALHSNGSSSKELYDRLRSLGFSLSLLNRGTSEIEPCAYAPSGNWDTVIARGR